MSESIQVDDLLTISDLETLKVVSDPLRMRILDSIGLANQLGQLQTVKQMAAEINVPLANLYYHINLLEKHGLVRVANTQIVSGIIEKHYQVTAHSITIDRDLLSTGVSKDEKAEAVLSLLDSTLDATRTDMLRLIRAIAEDDQAAARYSGRHSQITRDNALLSPAQAKAFNTRLAALLEEFRHMTPPEGEQGLVYSVTVVFTPILDSELPAG